MSWSEDLERSTEQFQTTVWPTISESFDGGELVPVEAVTVSEMHETLDQLAGIDFWIVGDDGMRGLASRVQDQGVAWDTFTIRKERKSGTETEYDKRKRAMDEDYLTPHWTVQAYLSDDGELLSAAVCETDSLIKWIQMGVEGEHYEIRRTYEDGVAWFYTIEWSDFSEHIEAIYRAGSDSGSETQPTLAD